MEWLRQKFELSRGGGAHNLRSMEGLRGFAVFLVFLIHYVTLSGSRFAENAAISKIAGAFYILGNAGVDLFFVLSGYLIYGSLIARPQRFTRFISRRIERIYPTFVVVFLIYVALSFVFHSENKIPAPASLGAIYLVANFLLLPGIFPIDPLITVAWSLSYEMLFYLAIPLLIALLHLHDRRVAWRVSFFAIVAALVVFCCAAYGGPVRLIMFISGIFLYEAMDSPRVPTPRSSLAFFVLVVGLLSTLLPLSSHPALAFKAVILFASFFVLCLACFRAPGSWLARAFSWTPIRWLGNMSYSYYLLHGLALKAAFLVFAAVLPIVNRSFWLSCALLLVMFAITLVPTAALFLAVERPFSLSRRGGHSFAPGANTGIYTTAAPATHVSEVSEPTHAGGAGSH